MPLVMLSRFDIWITDIFYAEINCSMKKRVVLLKIWSQINKEIEKIA